MIQVVKADGIQERALLSQLKNRSEEVDRKVTVAVTEIIDAVRAKGDEAVREYTLKFDGKCPEQFEISKADMQRALDEADPEFVASLQRAKENIVDFHRRQKHQSFIDAKANGVILGQRIRGLHRVGLYVPGGDSGLSLIGFDECYSRQSGRGQGNCDDNSAAENWWRQSRHFSGGGYCWC